MCVRTAVLVLGLLLGGGVQGRAEPAADGAPAPAASPAAEPVAAPGPPTISPRAAADHVGEQVIVEGRVHAVHVSPLATVLAFAPNYAGFTATIHAADRARFAANVHDTIRDRSVRLRGRISTYRGRAEMTLSDPSQLVLLDPVKPPPAPRATGPDPAEIQATLTRIEERLDALERRLATIERSAAAPTAELSIGMTADAAEATLGPPLDEITDRSGTRVWLYEDGRTLTLDASERVVAWSGF